MTREERDKREAEKRARMEGSPDLGGVTLPFSRATLLKVFWVFAAVFPALTLWNARSDLTFETTVAGTILFVACLLPSWFWVTGRIQGLPIFPLFGLSFLNTYVTPLWEGHKALVYYTPNEINTAVWTVAGFLLIAQLFWQQMAVRAVGVPQAVRMIDLKKAEKVLLVCLMADVTFELLSLFLWQLGGGAFSAIRGFTSAAGRMGIFVFSYQMGAGNLKPAIRAIFLGLLGLLIIQETASLILATVLPTAGLAFAGFILGSGKIPWKALVASGLVITVLHAGKFDMREIYLENRAKTTGLMDYPRYFGEWVAYGLKNLGVGKKKSSKRDDVSSTKERAALIQLLIMIQTTTPSSHPFLRGETYREIPFMLIPRVLNPSKATAHTGNMILSLHYGILDEIGIWKTSVGFDPIMEAYANFGFIGVLVLSVVFGFFVGWATKLTIHVPMLSFGFLFGVQVIAAVVASFNTAGVFVTTTWQSFLALAGLSLFLMSKQNNPVWKYYALKLAEKLKFKSDAKLKKTLEEVRSVLSKEDNNKDIGYGISDMGDNSAGGGRRDGAVSGRPASISENSSAVSQKHERPTRFVYGEKKG